MEERRLELHSILVAILGSHHVYYQPPESLQLKYPAIVYERAKINSKHADDGVYMRSLGYTVTVIDSDPDSAIVDKISMLPLCSWDRQFKSNNLNHDVFTLYY